MVARPRNAPGKPNSVASLSLRQRQRYVPPTRTSISHTGIDQPGGPRSQRCTSRGSVYARYTSGRGALNYRVTLTSRSLGRVTCAFSIVIGMSPSFVGFSRVSALPFCPPPRARRRGRPALQLLQNAVEALEVRFPARAISLEPGARLSKRLPFETAGPPLSILTNRGTALGMGAFVIALAGFGSQLTTIWRHPSPAGVMRASLFLGIPLTAAWLINRSLRGSSNERHAR